MRFTDNQSLDTASMANLDILAGTDVSSGTDKKFTLANLASWFLGQFNGLSLGGSARTVKTAIDALQTDVDKKADADGEYDSLVVGTSKQLLSDTYTEDFTPYKFRKSPYTDRLSESIVGVSCAWNQMMDKSGYPASKTESGITFTNNGDGSVTANGTASATVSFEFQAFPVGSWVQGHKFYAGVNFGTAGSSSTYELQLYRWGTSATSPNTALSVYQNSIIEKSAVSGVAGAVRLVIRSGATVTNLKCTPQIIDLTQMFGATVADALYAMGDDGVSLFRQMFPKDYYAYATPTLEHVYGLQSHDMTVGDKIYSYALDASLTLRGILKYDPTKGFYADGDTYEAKGTVTRKYGIVNLGTLTWTYNSSAARFATTGLGNIAKLPSSNAMIGNILCPEYLTEIANYSVDATKDKIIMLANSGGMYVRDSSYTDAASFKAALSGVYLVYELATPTTEEADPFEAVQITDGTEEYATDCLAPVGHESKYYENLRSKIEGLPTDFSAIICATEATNKASRNYAVGDYLIYENTLYKVTTAIAANATLTVGTNITATTIMAEIKALQ